MENIKLFEDYLEKTFDLHPCMFKKYSGQIKFNPPIVYDDDGMDLAFSAFNYALSLKEKNV